MRPNGRIDRKADRKLGRKADWVILAAAVIAAALFTAGITVGAAEDPSASEDRTRLVSVQQLPENMNWCSLDESADADANAVLASPEEDSLFAELRSDPSPLSMAPQRRNPFGTLNTEQEEKEAAEARAHGARMPVRTIRDTAPTYSAVAVDVNSNEVILQDNNLWEYQVFDRLSPTPAGPTDITHAEADRSRRQDVDSVQQWALRGPATETSSRWNRTPATRWCASLARRSGDVPPKAILHTPHRVYNLAADESKQELFATVEFPPQVVVYRKDATGEEQAATHDRGRRHGLGRAAWHRRGRERPAAVRQHLGTSQRCSPWRARGSGFRPRSRSTRWMRTAMPSRCA